MQVYTFVLQPCIVKEFCFFRCCCFKTLTCFQLCSCTCFRIKFAAMYMAVLIFLLFLLNAHKQQKWSFWCGWCYGKCDCFHKVLCIRIAAKVKYMAFLFCFIVYNRARTHPFTYCLIWVQGWVFKAKEKSVIVHVDMLNFKLISWAELYQSVWGSLLTLRQLQKETRSSCKSPKLGVLKMCTTSVSH